MKLKKLNGLLSLRPSPDEIEESAEEYHSEFEFISPGNLWSGSQINIEYVLECTANTLGWDVYHEFDSPLLGSTCDYTTHGYCDFAEKTVYLDWSEPIKEGSRRFAQAHELYHLLHHREYAHKHGCKAWPSWTEANASHFARAFLLPKKEFTEAFYEECSLQGIHEPMYAGDHYFDAMKEAICYLAGTFGTSGFPTAVRIKDLNLLSDRDRTQKWLLDPKPYYFPKKR